MLCSVALSLVEVEVVVYSLLVRWSWCWFVSLFGRGGLWSLYCLGGGCIGCLVEFDTPVFGRPFVLPRWRLYRLREEFGTPSGLKILLGEGGDVELGARTSKHILLFAFDPLTLNSLSLYLCCASFIS